MGAVSMPVGSAQVRRSLDRSDHRKPLRVLITRRRAPRRAGVDKFVTQVRFGGASAVVVPWKDGRGDREEDRTA